ncbi:hypothetical protein [Methylobacterium oxalidis]|nr:hypothetical protein [Methylobacterium oxalidis]
MLWLTIVALSAPAHTGTASVAPLSPSAVAIPTSDTAMNRVVQRRAFRGRGCVRGGVAGRRAGGFRSGFAGRRMGGCGRGIGRRGIAGGYGRPGWHGGGVRRPIAGGGRRGIAGGFAPRGVVRRNGMVGGVYRPNGAWWRPGAAVAAGAAIGIVGAATAAAWAGAPPAPGYCWYDTDASRTKGFRDRCP